MYKQLQIMYRVNLVQLTQINIVLFGALEVHSFLFTLGEVSYGGNESCVVLPEKCQTGATVPI
jgi:hypothetical protein